VYTSVCGRECPRLINKKMREEKDSLRNRNKGNKASSFHPTLDSSTLVFGDLFWGTYSARRPFYSGKTLGVPRSSFAWAGIFSRFANGKHEPRREHLSLASKLVDFSTITFGWSTLRRRTENHSSLPFLSSLNSQFAAGFGFQVECPRDGRRPTDFA